MKNLKRYLLSALLLLVGTPVAYGAQAARENMDFEKIPFDKLINTIRQGNPAFYNALNAVNDDMVDSMVKQLHQQYRDNTPYGRRQLSGALAEVKRRISEAIAHGQQSPFKFGVDRVNKVIAVGITNIKDEVDAKEQEEARAQHLVAGRVAQQQVQHRGLVGAEQEEHAEFPGAPGGPGGPGGRRPSGQGAEQLVPVGAAAAASRPAHVASNRAEIEGLDDLLMKERDRNPANLIATLLRYNELTDAQRRAVHYIISNAAGGSSNQVRDFGALFNALNQNNAAGIIELLDGYYKYVWGFMGYDAIKQITPELQTLISRAVRQGLSNEQLLEMLLSSDLSKPVRRSLRYILEQAGSDPVNMKAVDTLANVYRALRESRDADAQKIITDFKASWNVGKDFTVDDFRAQRALFEKADANVMYFRYPGAMSFFGKMGQALMVLAILHPDHNYRQ